MASRSKSVLIRLTPHEHAELLAKAAADNLSIGSYVRVKLLGSAPTSATYRTPNNSELARRIATLDTQIAQVQARLGGKDS